MQDIIKKSKDHVTRALTFCILWHLCIQTLGMIIPPLLLASNFQAEFWDAGPLANSMSINNGTATFVFLYKFIEKFQAGVSLIRQKIELKLTYKTLTPVLTLQPVSPANH